MADNEAITAGSGTAIAADDVSSVYYQYIKLASSESASADLIGDDDQGSTRSLWITERPKNLALQVNSSGLTTASTAYSIGDTLGAGWEFTNFARAAGGYGRLTGAQLVDRGDVTLSVSFFLAPEAVTFGTDNAGPSISDADADKLIGQFTLGMTDLGGARFGSLDSISIPYNCTSTSLFVYAITNTAHTFFAAVSDLRLRLFTVLE
jgi:hypothetical protein